MTVAELIESLKALPPDARVLMNSKGDGFYDVTELQTQLIVVDGYSSGSYHGRHRRSDGLDLLTEHGVVLL